MKMKKCPICKETKPFEEFNKSFSKERQKYRISNYCKPCAKINARARALKSYREKKEIKLEYAREYRAKNRARINANRAKYKKIYVDNLQACYVAEQCARTLKSTPQEIRQIPGLLEAYKTNILIKRKIKQHG